jgi:UDP-3-O-[3-hydroxymyristoyl] N-acetylglucosamine deacetylase
MRSGSPISVEDSARIEHVRKSSRKAFSSLAEVAGLDPSVDFRFLDLSGVDFGGSDLRSYDFTGANLCGTNWTGATYNETTIISEALMHGAVGFVTPKTRPQKVRLARNWNRQTTLRSHASLTGVGIHSGLPVTLTLGPAPVDAGFIFVRSGLDSHDREVGASAEAVVATDLATVLGDRDGPLVSSVENVLAALRGLGIDNAIIEVDGPEVPIMDGSAAAFVAAIDQASIVAQSAARRFIQVLKPVQVAIGDSFADLRPFSGGFRVQAEIDFANPLIGHQVYSTDINPENFRREISRARTFGEMKDINRLWSAGFALGASFENSLIFDEARLLNPEGLRYSDECVRHKILDIVGDLALAGLPLLGAFRSVRGGHKLNLAVLTAFLADRSAWRVVEAAGRSGQTKTIEWIEMEGEGFVSHK